VAPFVGAEEFEGEEIGEEKIEMQPVIASEEGTASPDMRSSREKINKKHGHPVSGVPCFLF